MSFQKNFKNLLKEKHMTQKQLAKKTHLTERSVSYYANGKREPNLVHAKKIAKILDVSLDDLAK